MTTMKSLAIVALLFGGTSLALAQTPPTTGPNPPANVTAAPTGGAAYTSGPSANTGHAVTQHKKMHTSAKSSKHKNVHMSANSNNHKKMYMSAGSRHHKPLKTGQPQPKKAQ